jgi:hypothetical protein
MLVLLSMGGNILAVFGAAVFGALHDPPVLS